MKTGIATEGSQLQLKRNFEALRQSPFVKHVLIVMSGTGIAQVIGFVMSPIISRLFSPSEFGVFGSFNAIATITAMGATLQYSQAIILPQKTEDGLNLFFVSCFCTLGIGFLCLIACILIPTYLNQTMKTNGVWALMLLIVATVVSGINTSCQAWCIRRKCFKHTSASQVVRSVSSSGSQVSFGFLKAGSWGLVLSSILADVLASINLISVVLSDVKTLRRTVQWGRMKQLAKEYSDFPMYSASQNVINALSSGLPVLFLTHFYGLVVAGAYAFGVRILQIPMGFVLTSLRQVLFQKASEVYRKGHNLLFLYTKITIGLFAVILFPSLLLFMWAPGLFKVVFGSQWDMAGEFARWLILWLMFYFCNLPAVLFAQIIRIQRSIFLYDLVLLVARAGALVVGGVYLSALGSIVLFSVVGAGMNAVLILLVGRALLKREGHGRISVSDLTNT